MPLLNPSPLPLTSFQANVLIGDDGEVRLTDLGLARILEVSGFTTRTPSSTFRFMAPELVPLEEQAEMPIPRVTAATDVWAFSMCVIEVRLTCCDCLSLRRSLAHSYTCIFTDHDSTFTLLAHSRRSRRHCPCSSRWPSLAQTLSGDQRRHLAYAGDMLAC